MVGAGWHGAEAGEAEPYLAHGNRPHAQAPGFLEGNESRGTQRREIGEVAAHKEVQDVEHGRGCMSRRCPQIVCVWSLSRVGVSCVACVCLCLPSGLCLLASVLLGVSLVPLCKSILCMVVEACFAPRVWVWGFWFCLALLCVV
jgi:hypothetical protein